MWDINVDSVFFWGECMRRTVGVKKEVGAWTWRENRMRRELLFSSLHQWGPLDLLLEVECTNITLMVFSFILVFLLYTRTVLLPQCFGALQIIFQTTQQHGKFLFFPPMFCCYTLTSTKKKKKLLSLHTLSPSLLSFCKRSTINQLIKDSKVGPRTILLQTDLNEPHWFCFTNHSFSQKYSPSQTVRSMLLTYRFAFDVFIQPITINN